MRFVEISKPLITDLVIGTQLLREGKDGKNVHLEHIEDNIFNKGFAGAKEAINYLYSLHEMLEGHSKASVSMTTKWDGAPAIVAGRDPQTGKFFVGTKGVFAQTPKLNFTVADIKKNHPAEELQKKLIVALNNLSKLKWTTVVQGDMLYTKDDLKTTTIDGEQYVIFTPNTITYAVPVGSDLAKQITKSQMGIVWHTEYQGGPTLADTKAKFGFNSSTLGTNPAVWHRDARIHDLSGTVTLTVEESQHIIGAISDADHYLKNIDSKTFSWLERGTSVIGSDFVSQLKAHVNNAVRAGAWDEPTKFAQGFVQKYINSMTKNIEKYKTDAKKQQATDKMIEGVKFIKDHVKEIVAVYDLYLKIIEAKVRLIRKLEQIRQIPTFKQEGDSFVATNEEGFVAVDRMGNALKLVDRLEFSRLNFGSGKPGAK